MIFLAFERADNFMARPVIVMAAVAEVQAKYIYARMKKPPDHIFIGTRRSQGCDNFSAAVASQ
jgi:hypothetical protein